ncbi:MAG: hypothetical protein ACREDR_05945 [Blastocatellia bacterium]
MTRTTKAGPKIGSKARPTVRTTRETASLDSPEDWLRQYYIPDYSIQRAASDLMSNSTTEQAEDFAGRMFALQDLIYNEDLDNISSIEQESDSPFFLAIVEAVRKEAQTGDPEYATSIAGEFLEKAFRHDSRTIRLWQEYEYRMRQRRIDAGLGFIEPPDERIQKSEDRSQNEEGLEPSVLAAARIEVETLKVKTLKVKTLNLRTLKPE